MSSLLKAVKNTKMNHELSFFGRNFGAVGHLLVFNFALVAVNVIAGLLGLQLAAPPGYATVIWPPSGIALAALVLFGPALLPGIFVASVIINIYVGGTGLPGVTMAFAIAFGSTLQALVARAVLQKVFGRVLTFDAWRDLGIGAIIAAPLSCVIGASVGSISLFAGGFIPLAAIPETWVTWWTGDTLGVIVFLPLALLAPGIKPRIRLLNSNLRGFSAVSILSVLLPLGISFYSFVLVSHLNYQRGSDEFDKVTEDNHFSLSFRFDKYEQALDAGVAMFDAAERVTLPEWERYFDSADLLANLPGINGMGYIENVRDGEHDAFLEQARADGVEGLQIKGEGPETFVIKYITPIAPNQAAVGLNIAFEESRYAAAVRAAETGQARITNRIVLVQDKTRSVGFLILKPFYERGVDLSTPQLRRNSLEGWVYAPLVSHVFLSDLTPRQGQDFNLRIYDGTEINPDRLIFADQPAEVSEKSDFTRQVTVDFLGVPWTLVWHSLPEFDKNHTSVLPMILLGLGIVVSGLSGSLIMSYVRREDTIREQVRNQTQIIAARERMSQSLLDTAHCAILMIDVDGVVKLGNNYAGEFLVDGAASKLLGMQLHDILPVFRDVDFRDLARSGRRLSNVTFEIQTRIGPRIFNFHITPWQDHRDRPRFTLLGDDITLQKTHERALERNNRRWLTALAGSGIGVFELDLEQQSSIVNDTWWKIFGVAPRDDVNPQSFFKDRIHPEDVERLTENDSRCLAGDIRTSVTDIRFRHSSGQWRWLRSHANIYTHDVEGKPSRMIGTQFDVTELKRAEAELQESLETFRIAHQDAPVGIALVDGAGRMTRVNAALCALAERSEAKLVSAPRGDLAVAEDRAQIVAALDEARALPGKSVSQEWRLSRPDGGSVWVRSSIAVARAETGERALFVETFEDIDAARKVDQLKTEFVSTVSHELRTPLTAIRGALWLINREISAGREEKAVSLLDVASSNCEQLIHLVNDILDTDKLASGQMDFTFELHDIEALLLESIEVNQTYAAEREIVTALKVKCAGTEIEIDAARFRQVISNLLSNAIKFSPEHSTVRVGCFQVDDHVRIEIADQGPGISPQLQEQIFERFKQLRQTEIHKHSGSGLGLHISKMIVQAMHGRIGVVSTPGNGAVFWLELPVARRDE